MLANSPIKAQTLEEVEQQMLGKNNVQTNKTIYGRLRSNSETSPSPPRSGNGWPHHMSPTLSTSNYSRPPVPPNTLPHPVFNQNHKNNFPTSPNVASQNGKGRSHKIMILKLILIVISRA